MKFSPPSVPCRECDGDGVVGMGGPGNYPCERCRRSGLITQQTMKVTDVIEALQANAGYTPSGNHVIREIAKALGLKEKS